MTRTRYLLALAKLEAEQRRMLGVFATAGDLDLVVIDDTNQALLWLERHDASLILFNASIPKAERLCHKARAKRSLAGIPVLALTEELADVFTEKLYGLGVDDVVSSSAWPALIARLRALPKEDAALETPKLGRAVVADSDRARCDIIGHVLQNAGFELRYAVDDRVLAYYATQSDVRLVVASAELAPPRASIEQARNAGCDAAWIVMSSKRELDAHTQALADLPRVATISQNGPAEDVLFLANELTSGKSGSGRASERVLYGTAVAFRKAGADTDDIGFTYNISARGLYVRTLAPPDGDLVWLELRPPRAKERVRLEGQVVWRCSFSRAAGASAPPGFALRLSDGLGDGLKAWIDCYDFHVGSKRAGLGGGVTQRPTGRAKDEDQDPTLELAHAIVGTDSESEPRLAAAATRTALPSVPESDSHDNEVVIPSSKPVVSTAQTREAESKSDSPTRTDTPSRRAVVIGVVLALIGGALLLFLYASPDPSKSLPKSPTPAAANPALTLEDRSPAAPLTPSAGVAFGGSSSESDKIDGEARGAIEPPSAAPDLLPNQGWLIVSSNVAASVYSNGIAAGPTNQALKVRCGPRFLRLGGAAPGEWLSEGLTSHIACRSVTRVTLDALAK